MRKIFTLTQSKRIRGQAGEPLPAVFTSLEQKGTKFVRGALTLIAAGPGTGKSAFTLTLALRAGVPCLYFSADSDAFTQLTRAISILTGCTLGDAAKSVLEDGDIDSVADHSIRFSYDSSPSLDGIERSLYAYEEVYGEYPELIVVDNVTNCRSGGDNDDDPFSGLEGLMDYLHSTARETGACVIGLHHVTGPYNNSDKPIPLDGVKGQISRVPKMILTLHKRSSVEGFPDTLCVSTVKNSNGPSDTSGYSFVELEFDGQRMKIADPSFSDSNLIWDALTYEEVNDVW